MQKKSNLTKILVATGIACMWMSSSAAAQDYNDALDYFYFGRQPSAKAEAMGKAMVATNADAYSSFYNPAAISLNQGRTASTSYASPYYGFNDANYLFAGITGEWGDRSAVGLSFFRFSFGESQSMSSVQLPDGPGETFTPAVTMYTLSLSSRIVHNLHAGINLNYVRDEGYFDDATLPIDIGLIQTFHLTENQNLKFGASLFNINDSKLKLEEIGVYTQEAALPISFRTGASYQLLWGSSTLNATPIKTYGVSWQVEYVELLNSDYYSGIRTGAEFTFMEMVSMRLGYYNENRNDYGYPESNKDELSDFTYGLGVAFPIEGLFNDQSSLTAKLDLARMKQPSASKNFDNFDSFSVYNLSLIWTPESK
ncbi:MAG: hypothetical protein DWQ10_16955 [Calditrichaeota bacterium]|nr:MAG: hypothetical protein DWQ10_16955 [Calditrichota bacterium]